MEADNAYEGDHAIIKSVFNHSTKEVQSKLNEIKMESL
jgi:hypothetical protein